MLEDVLDVQSWNEPGYRSLVFSDGWRAAMLNDVSRFYKMSMNFKDIIHQMNCSFF